jgi:hypothetical protein
MSTLESERPTIPSTHYGDELTLREARSLYFERNAFGADGGYGDAWVDFTIGPVSLPFPNTAGRIEALKFHDLHHVLTGYATNALGEFQISAWEIGAGCGSMPTAWVINSGGLVAGLFSHPRLILAAFVRGRRSRSLYAETFEPLLDETVGAARARVVANVGRVTAADYAAFVLAAALGIVVGALFLAVTLPLVPVGHLAKRLRDRERRLKPKPGASIAGT